MHCWNDRIPKGPCSIHRISLCGLLHLATGQHPDAADTSPHTHTHRSTQIFDSASPLKYASKEHKEPAAEVTSALTRGSQRINPALNNILVLVAFGEWALCSSTHTYCRRVLTMKLSLYCKCNISSHTSGTFCQTPHPHELKSFPKWRYRRHVQATC